MTAPETQTAQDSGSFAAFYAMMLHIDDDDLDPFEYRLLGHYRKICGLFKSETCTESIETTAKASHMSVAKVRDARKSLEQKGRIKVANVEGHCMNITVVNCMEENLRRYTDPYQKHKGYQKRNPYQKHKDTPIKSDSPPLPDSIADIRIEEKKEEDNTKTLAPASPAPNISEVPISSHETTILQEVPKQRKSSGKKKADVPPMGDPVLDAITVLCYGTKEAYLPNSKRIRNCYRDCMSTGSPPTIEQMRGFYVWWKQNDWRGKKGQPPKPSQVSELWATFKRGVTPNGNNVASHLNLNGLRQSDWDDDEDAGPGPGAKSA